MEVQLRVGLAGVVRFIDGDGCAADEESGILLSGRPGKMRCDEPGYLASQVFAVAAETGWPEERILFMPLARLAQCLHCLLRRNGMRTVWMSQRQSVRNAAGELQALRNIWRAGAAP